MSDFWIGFIVGGGVFFFVGAAAFIWLVNQLPTWPR